jgi:hypothetical protein
VHQRAGEGRLADDVADGPHGGGVEALVQRDTAALGLVRTGSMLR